MNKRKFEYSFEYWQANQLKEIPAFYMDSSGKKKYMSILEACAWEYPENLEKFAVRVNSEKCFPPLNRSEVREYILKALRIEGESSSSVHSSGSGMHTHKLKYDPIAVQRFIEDIPVDVDETFLRKRSPMPIDGMSSTLFLNTVFKKKDEIYVTDNLNEEKPRVVLVTIGEEMPNPKLERLAKKNQKGVWYLPNPVCGKMVKSGFDSPMKCKAALAAFPFLVLESDYVSESDWLKIVCSLELPIAALYKSGRRSVHTLIKIDAKSVKDWEAKVAPLKEIMVPLGADPAVMRVGQLSRLPQCLRGNTGRLQELLYLDPEPDGVPIIEKPYINYSVDTRNKIKNYSHFLRKFR